MGGQWPSMRRQRISQVRRLPVCVCVCVCVGGTTRCVVSEPKRGQEDFCSGKEAHCGAVGAYTQTPMQGSPPVQDVRAQIEHEERLTWNTSCPEC